MFTPLIAGVGRIAGYVARSLTKLGREVAQRLAAAWGRHRDLMAANPAYSAALVGGAASIVAQVSLDRLAVALILAAIALYAASHQDRDSWRADQSTSLQNGCYDWEPR